MLKLSNEQHKVLLFLVLLIAIFTRIYALFKTGGIIHPDELYQYIEQPHRLIFGYGIIPWEFIDGARSWFYPIIVYIIFKTSAIVGFDKINEMLFSVRLLSMIFSILLIFLIYLIGKELYNKNVGLIAAFFAVFSSSLILWTARLMPEIYSTFFSTLSVFLLYTGIKNKDKLKISMSGIFIGLSFMFVFRSAILLIPLSVYAIYRRYGIHYILAGFSVILITQGILDIYTWGSFLHSPLEYLKFNLIENKSIFFGTEPIWFYIYPLILHIPLLLLIPYTFKFEENTRYLLLNFGLYFLIFSLIPHKEERYTLQIMPLFLILAARGFEKFTMKFSGAEGKVIIAGLIISYIAISPINPAIYDNSMWAPFSDNLKAMEYVGLQNDSTGVLYTVSWGNSGVYTYLHKNIPVAYLTLNTTLCDEIHKNPSKSRYYFPRGFQCYLIGDIVDNPYMNYVVTSSSERPYIMPFLYENNFTEVRTFGNIAVFKRLY